MTTTLVISMITNDVQRELPNLYHAEACIVIDRLWSRRLNKGCQDDKVTWIKRHWQITKFLQ